MAYAAALCAADKRPSFYRHWSGPALCCAVVQVEIVSRVVRSTGLKEPDPKVVALAEHIIKVRPDLTTCLD